MKMKGDRDEGIQVETSDADADADAASTNRELMSHEFHPMPACLANLRGELNLDTSDGGEDWVLNF